MNSCRPHVPHKPLCESIKRERCWKKLTWQYFFASAFAFSLRHTSGWIKMWQNRCYSAWFFLHSVLLPVTHLRLGSWLCLRVCVHVSNADHFGCLHEAKKKKSWHVLETKTKKKKKERSALRVALPSTIKGCLVQPWRTPTKTGASAGPIFPQTHCIIQGVRAVLSTYAEGWCWGSVVTLSSFLDTQFLVSPFSLLLPLLLCSCCARISVGEIVCLVISIFFFFFWTGQECFYRDPETGSAAAPWGFCRMPMCCSKETLVLARL